MVLVVVDESGGESGVGRMDAASEGVVEEQEGRWRGGAEVDEGGI